jgi:two-component system, NtrC family, response regulator AtoC
VQQICRELGRAEPRIPLEIMGLLEAYSWPGNIRELKNVMERAVLLCAGPVLDTEHLPMEKLGAPTTNPGLPRLETSRPVATADAPDERQRIIDALAACAGNQSRAAKSLGIPRRTFVARLDQYKIPRPKKSG